MNETALKALKTLSGIASFMCAVGAVALMPHAVVIGLIPAAVIFAVLAGIKNPQKRP